MVKFQDYNITQSKFKCLHVNFIDKQDYCVEYLRDLIVSKTNSFLLLAFVILIKNKF